MFLVISPSTTKPVYLPIISTMSDDVVKEMVEDYITTYHITSHRLVVIEEKTGDCICYEDGAILRVSDSG